MNMCLEKNVPQSYRVLKMNGSLKCGRAVPERMLLVIDRYFSYYGTTTAYHMDTT